MKYPSTNPDDAYDASVSDGSNTKSEQRYKSKDGFEVLVVREDGSAYIVHYNEEGDEEMHASIAREVLEAHTAAVVLSVLDEIDDANYDENGFPWSDKVHDKSRKLRQKWGKE